MPHLGGRNNGFYWSDMQQMGKITLINLTVSCIPTWDQHKQHVK